MFVRRPDASLFALSFGQGPLTMLALGGWIGSGELWHDLFGHLPHWRCVSYDHRGSGASTHQGTITLDAMVDDLFAVADGMQVGRCVLAAESAGAGVALEAVRRQPKRFSALVTAGAAWHRVAPGAQDGFIAALRRDYEATLRGFVGACLPEPDTEDLARWGMHILRRAPVEHAIELLRCREQLKVQDHLPEITLPTLVLHGALDTVSPLASARALAAALPRAELHVLDGLGHVPTITAPARVAGLVNSWAQTQAVRDTAKG